MFEDVRDAVRSLTRAKRLMLMLLVSLALATGANVAVGRAVYALLFQAPAGVSAPGGLVSIYTSQSGGAPYGPSSYTDYDAVRSGAAAITLVSAMDDRAFANVGVDGQTARARIAAVSGSFFSMLGLQPHAGRLLDAGDAARRPRPVVLGFSRWQALGGETRRLNGTILIGADEYVIVGVAPRGFRGMLAGRATDIWVPLMPPGEGAREHRVLSLYGRLAPGARIEDAARDTRAITTRRAASAPTPETSPETGPGTSEPRRDQSGRISVTPYTRLEPERRRRTLQVAAVVIGTMILLLASGCANAANLLVSRAAARRNEAAIKVALGASRIRLMRQALAESLVVTVSSAAVGLPLASAMTAAVPLLFSADHAELVDSGFDLPLIASILIASLVCGLGVGLAPAVRLLQTKAASAVRGDAGGISPQGGATLRTALVSGQIALSILLLILTGVMRRSVNEGLTGDLGFSARRVAMIAVDGPGGPLTPNEPWRFTTPLNAPCSGSPAFATGPGLAFAARAGPPHRR